jgi:DNA-binding NtrC family response regulator
VAEPIGERILLIEDERLLRTALARVLTSRGYEVIEAASLADVEARLKTQCPDLVLADYELADGNTLEIMPRLRGPDGSTPVIFMTGMGSIELAVNAMQAGAEQFLTKPIANAALLLMIERVLGTRRMTEAARRTRQAALDPFIGTSDAIKELREQAGRLAGVDGSVLILGETGSGKGVLARWLHESGPRGKQPFVDLNCAGLSRELLESELFGHERGAFTGAVGKQGLLEVAHKGTVFLDEIGDVDLQVQPRLLKVLEEKRFRRLGDVRDRTVDIRLIAATHYDLAKAVREKKFREDLFYRLSVLPIDLPPLRERPEDVPLLAERLLPPGVTLGPDAVKAVQLYAWPGNVRELRNVLERAVVISGKKTLDVHDLRLSGGRAPDEDAQEPPLTLEEVEKRHIERILRREHGNVSHAAKVLGLARSTLYQMMLRLGLSTKV